MQTLTFVVVVDELAAELRERRRERNEGYVALARAILINDAVEFGDMEDAAA